MVENSSRRDFLRNAAILGAALAAGGCGKALLPTPKPVQRPQPTAVPQEPTPKPLSKEEAAVIKPNAQENKVNSTPVVIIESTPATSPTPTATPTIIPWETYLKTSPTMEVPTLDPAEIPHRRKRIIPEATPTVVILGNETPETLKRFFIYKGDSSKPRLALTFDDGYIKASIQQFIDIITSKEIQALGPRFTLFLVGEVMERYPDLVKTLYNLGCKIECHSFSHPKDFALLSVDEILREIDLSQKAKNKAIGKNEDFRLFRPPGGNISESIVLALQARNLKGVIWNYSGHGTSPIATPQYVIDRIMSLAQKGRESWGSISLHHFIKNDTEALRQILLDLGKLGIRAVTVDELI